MAEKEAKIGDNSVATAEMLKYLERIDRLEDEKAELSADISEVWAEAKSAGYDVKAMRRVHSLRKLDAGQRSMIGLYADKLGVFG